MERKTYDQALEDATFIANQSIADNNLQYAGKLHSINNYVEYIKTHTKIAQHYRARLKQIARRKTLRNHEREDIERRIEIITTSIDEQQRNLAAARGQLRDAIRQANRYDSQKSHAAKEKFMDEFKQHQEEITAMATQKRNF